MRGYDFREGQVKSVVYRDHDSHIVIRFLIQDAPNTVQQIARGAHQAIPLLLSVVPRFSGVCAFPPERRQQLASVTCGAAYPSC